MVRALVHVGLAVALVLSPTLCCCKAWRLAPAPVHSHRSTLLSTQPVPTSSESCCLKAKPTCCESHDHPSKPSEKSEPVRSSDCACCAERPDAAPPENTVTESNPQPTGELLSLALGGLLGHFGHARSAWVENLPDGIGVDARYSALFERHVLRC